jgi:hypothetical protein
MCNEHMSIIDGKFKLPLLRGEQTPTTEHFRTIERNIANDLNAWLCNAYVEVVHRSIVFNSLCMC